MLDQGLTPFIKEQQPLLYGLVVLLVLGIWLYRVSIATTNVPKIKGIPEIPGAIPIAGHLPLLGGSTGKADTTVWTEWYQKYGWELFQMRFGQERVVVANTYSAIREIWVGNSAAVISRPIPYTVETFIGREMGASPWDDACKRQRGAAVKSVAAGTWQSFYPGLDQDTRSVVEQIKSQGEYGKKPMELGNILSLVGMNLGFLLSYGKTSDDLGGPAFLHGFIKAASKITEVRVGSSNWVDYIPFLRVLPSRSVARAIEGVKERQPYLDRLYDSMKKDVEKGRDVHCIGASMLSDKESRLTTDDVKATCISMLQGSSETIAGVLTCGLGSLCASEAGIKLQDELYSAIVEKWGSPENAFGRAFDSEDIPLVVATYKEMLRYYCIVTYALPRMTIRDITIKSGVTIPKGTTLFMNAEGGCHDTAFYGADAEIFNPYRFMDAKSPVSSTSLPHFAYGAGARICPAMQISNRILYAFIVRLVVSFRFVASKDRPPIDHPVKYNQAPAGFVAKIKPYDAYCVPRQ
ncbi:cytochrome P450 [Hypoxylon crocopeplum]|nr:cytochrome P450 [Hypoxylon crocopeplum]